MIEDLIPETFVYETAYSAHLLLEQIVLKKLESAKFPYYGLTL